MSNFEYLNEDYDRWDLMDEEPLTKEEILKTVLIALIAAPFLWGFVWLLCAIGNAFS